MRLSRPTILREIQEGRLEFNPPLEENQIGVSSVDLRLGDSFIHLDKEFQELREAGLDVALQVQEVPWSKFVEKVGRKEKVRLGKPFLLERTKLVLGFTLEYMKLPPSLAGRVEGKSAYARRGLLIHLTAPTIQAGWEGQLQLELYNLGPAPLILWPRKPICQLILEQVTEPQRYGGEFQKQKPPRARRLKGS
jgi:dCTP deaminase